MTRREIDLVMVFIPKDAVGRHGVPTGIGEGCGDPEYRMLSERTRTRCGMADAWVERRKLRGIRRATSLSRHPPGSQETPHYPEW